MKNINDMDRYMYDAILDAINKFLSEGIPAEEISIYIAQPVRKYMEMDYSKQMYTTPTEFKTLHNIRVVDGYDWESIVVSWDRGMYCQRKPIIIKHMIQTKS